MRTHLHAHPRRIYTTTFRTSFGLQRYLPPHLHRSASYAVLVHHGSVLPAASFGFHLAMDTLAVRLALPLVGRAGDLNPQVCAPCREHHVKPCACEHVQRRGALSNRTPGALADQRLGGRRPWTGGQQKRTTTPLCDRRQSGADCGCRSAPVSQRCVGDASRPCGDHSRATPQSPCWCDPRR